MAEAAGRWPCGHGTADAAGGGSADARRPHHQLDRATADPALARAGSAVAAKTIRRALHHRDARWNRRNNVVGRSDPAYAKNNVVIG
jgi:hypothetical protein